MTQPPIPFHRRSAALLARFACLAAMAAAATAHGQTAVAPQPVTAADVATKPLDDLNLHKEKIAQVLEAAKAHPYTLAGIERCAEMNREVATLTEALGPDIDAAATPSEQAKRDRAVGGTARSLVSSLIPFDGVIRQISGANAAEARREQYLYAGSVRRAFIKGYARARGCRIRPAVVTQVAQKR
jgi:hypothetical protein